MKDTGVLENARTCDVYERIMFKLLSPDFVNAPKISLSSCAKRQMNPGGYSR